MKGEPLGVEKLVSCKQGFPFTTFDKIWDGWVCEPSRLSEPSASLQPVATQNFGALVLANNGSEAALTPKILKMGTRPQRPIKTGSRGDGEKMPVCEAPKKAFPNLGTEWLPMHDVMRNSNRGYRFRKWLILTTERDFEKWMGGHHCVLTVRSVTGGIG